MSVLKKRASVIKLFFDKILSFTLIVTFSPVFFILIILLLIKIGRPVIFRQSRPGLHGETFEIYKFRTMSNEKDKYGQLLPDEKRLVGFGKSIRAMSLDELPQLFNVLKGEMSFVGPRPLLVEYLSLYSDIQRKRHDVKPGITGWAQVNGRNTISWEKKFEYDVWYAKHHTFWIDIKILGLTALKIIKPKDINAQSNIGMEKFKGNLS